MEQAFKNLEEFLEAQGAFGDAQLDEHLWVSAEQGRHLMERGLVFFIDSRDEAAYAVSHVQGALPLPGHTMEQLQGLLAHPTVRAIAASPASIVVVYSDNGSKLSRCVHVSRILRSVTQPERVRRLEGGLNGWKKLGLPVDGDARMMFAGRTMDAAALGMAGMGLG